MIMICLQCESIHLSLSQMLQLMEHSDSNRLERDREGERGGERDLQKAKVSNVKCTTICDSMHAIVR